MKIKITLKNLVLVFVLCVAGAQLAVFRTHAQSEATGSMPASCVEAGSGEATLPYTALYATEPGSYSVYARLGHSNQQAEASLYAQGLQSGSCTKIGQSNITGDVWHRIGTWQSNGLNEGTNFLFLSPAIEGLPVANRPSVMLVPDTNSICTPSSECEVTVEGQKGVVRASGTLLNEDTLHLVEVKDPAKDTIKQVNYYVDNRPVYNTKTLEDFNLRYVGSGKHTLTRVIDYESRQQVILTEQVDRDFENVLSHTIFSLVYGQKTLLEIICVIALFLTIIALLLTILRKRRQQHLWQESHIAHENLPNMPQPTPTRTQRIMHTLAERYGWIAVIVKNGTTVLAMIAVALGLILVTDGYVMQFYQTDGESMRTTLETGDRILINKLPKTWAQLNRKQYVPKRGEVIVVQKRQSPLLGGSSFNMGEQFWVKRVVGLPGERVVVAEGVMRVQNSERPGGFNPDGGVRWEANIQQPIIETLDVTLASDEIFIVGDNRPGSIDSRSFGPVKIDDVIGKVTLDLSPILKPKQL